MRKGENMKKGFSKVLSLALCAAMLVTSLVIPAYAINSLMDIPAKKGVYMTLETDKQSISYKSGDDVAMTVRLFDPSGKQISAPYIRYNLRVDGSNEGGYGEYQLNWVTVPFTDGEYTIRAEATPGFMRLRVDILDADKSIINRKYTASEGDWSEFGPSGQLSFFQGGVVVDVEDIRTTASKRVGEQVGSLVGVTYDELGMPSDFANFWANNVSELDKPENAPRLISIEEIPTSVFNNWYRYNHDLYALKISCPGDETDLKSGATYLTALLMIPKNADLGTAPIDVRFCGYGITKPTPVGSDANKGKIVVIVAAHSLDYDFQSSAQPTSDAFNLHADQQGATNYYGFSFTENQSRDKIYFKYMILRDLQAVRFVTRAFRAEGGFELDESASEATKALAQRALTSNVGLWDGKSLASIGSSQGGLQAVAVAALYSETVGGKEQRITSLEAGIPWMCDVQGNTDRTKVQSTYRQDYAKDGVEAVGLNYYDTANFGRFVQCDTVISAGMGDPLCPASGVSALYNNLRLNGSKIDITLGFTQGRTHSTNDNSAHHEEEKIYTIRSQQTGAELLNAITADGFKIRGEEYTGIRGLFTFSEAIAAENKELGYTLVEYGALTCSGEKYTQYGNSAEAIYNACGTDSYLVKVVVEGEGGVCRFVDAAKKQFCVSIINIPDEHYTSDVYMCGYQVWSDGTEEYFVATEYVPASGEKSYTSNLYELTMFGFKNGLVNSETMDDVCLWDVLETQAVTIDDFNEGEYTHSNKKYAVTADKAYTLDSDGSFIFKNIPLLDYTGSASSQVGWNFVPTGLEKQSTTGVEWTLLPDGEDYVAVFRRADGLAEDFKALIPRQTNDENSKAYFGHLPIHESWGCLTSAKEGEYAINSPRLPATDVAKIRTVVVDYGVNGHEAAGLGFIVGAHTVVYPNGYTNVADYGFNGCKQLKDVIWSNDGIPHGKDVEGIPEGEGLLDLRGMRELKTTRFIYGCSAVENIVFSTLNTSEARINSLFMNASRVKRAWISNAAQNGGVEKAPAANVIDMRAATNVNTLTAGAFEVGAVIHSIYLPATITTISENKSSYGYNMAFGNGYAHKIYTEQESFKGVLQKYYDYVKANFTGNAANALDKLIINDMPIAQYLAS